MQQRTPGSGAYARLEREQRWLLSGLPDDLVDPVDIQDRYLAGSTLRLRCMRSAAGTVYKLGQKVRAAPESPERVSLTNMYLSEREFELLGQLGGASLHKTRWKWKWPTGDHLLSVDVFEDSLDGLILAEVELREHDPLLPVLECAVMDVTHEDRFSGGWLAQLSEKEAAALLASVAELVRLGSRG